MIRRSLVPIGAAVLAALGALGGGCSEASVAPSDEPSPDSGTVTPPRDGAAGDARAVSRDCGADRARGMAQHLECAGLYVDLAGKRVVDGTLSFTPGVELWSDGAEKERFIQLPPGATIDTSDMDEWVFPVGTRLWKEFKVAGKRIETRLFEKTADGWQHATYRWDEAETEATRDEDGDTVQLPGRTPYEVPKREDCEFCHAGRREPVLGFEAVSLGLASAKGVTLASLASAGRLSAPPPASVLAIPDDGTGLAAPALGWLHANCGHCHNESPNAGAVGSSLRMLVRASELSAGGGVASARDLATWATGVCRLSERDQPEGGKYLYVAPGAPASSLLAILLGSRAEPGMESIVTQMPPVLTHQVDVAGKKLVDDWIGALPACP